MRINRHSVNEVYNLLFYGALIKLWPHQCWTKLISGGTPMVHHLSTSLTQTDTTAWTPGLRLFFVTFTERLRQASWMQNSFFVQNANTGAGMGSHFQLSNRTVCACGLLSWIELCQQTASTLSVCQNVLLMCFRTITLRSWPICHCVCTEKLI